jgi:homocysteine S-methyltransferase
VTTRAKYRERLPQLDDGLFLTDGRLETTLVFHDGFDLPCFAAFVLLDSERGRKALREYFDRYVPMAIAAGTGFVLESPTWRANPDWGAKVGYSLEALARNNRAAIEFLLELRDRYETPASPIVVSGAIGPRGDGYDPGTVMSAGEAAAYHSFQMGVFRDAGADLVSAFTMTNSNEAQGIVLAAPRAQTCLASFPSRSRPMGASPREKRWQRRSKASMPRRAEARPIT